MTTCSRRWPLQCSAAPGWPQPGWSQPPADGPSSWPPWEARRCCWLRWHQQPLGRRGGTSTCPGWRSADRSQGDDVEIPEASRHPRANCYGYWPQPHWPQCFQSEYRGCTSHSQAPIGSRSPKQFPADRCQWPPRHDALEVLALRGRSGFLPAAIGLAHLDEMIRRQLQVPLPTNPAGAWSFKFTSAPMQISLHARRSRCHHRSACVEKRGAMLNNLSVCRPSV